jgi:origin recognition complex subunit 1
MPHEFQSPPSRLQSRTKASRARRLLTRGPLLREDSDDELGYEDYPWEWVYGKEDSPTADRNGSGRGVNDPAENDVSAPTARRGSKPLRFTSRSHDQKIVGAKMGSFDCKIGDCVLLKAEGEGNGAWVGIICEFGEDENNEMSVNVMCR